MTEKTTKIHDTIDKITSQGTYKFDLADVDIDLAHEVFEKFLGVGDNTSHNFIVRPVKVKFPYEPLRKPSNLKYPNKKRKKRILKKWCKRYGKKHPTELFIPNAKIQTTLDPQTFAINVHIDAEGKNTWK